MASSEMLDTKVVKLYSCRGVMDTTVFSVANHKVDTTAFACKLGWYTLPPNGFIGSNGGSYFDGNHPDSLWVRVFVNAGRPQYFSTLSHTEGVGTYTQGEVVSNLISDTTKSTGLRSVQEWVANSPYSFILNSPSAIVQGAYVPGPSFTWANAYNRVLDAAWPTAERLPNTKYGYEKLDTGSPTQLTSKIDTLCNNKNCIGIIPAWGGALGSIIYNGIEMVNHCSAGTLIQSDFQYLNRQIWENPTEAGDGFDNGSPLGKLIVSRNSTGGIISTISNGLLWGKFNYVGAGGYHDTTQPDPDFPVISGTTFQKRLYFVSKGDSGGYIAYYDTVKYGRIFPQTDTVTSKKFDETCTAHFEPIFDSVASGWVENGTVQYDVKWSLTDTSSGTFLQNWGYTNQTTSYNKTGTRFVQAWTIDGANSVALVQTNIQSGTETLWRIGAQNFNYQRTTTPNPDTLRGIQLGMSRLRNYDYINAGDAVAYPNGYIIFGKKVFVNNKILNPPTRG